ncbi:MULTISPECIES: muramoyltetrapeptide carboxypeptidase [unclassified Raoultella]|uniref:muramoyltetrapeptide carboxypeptidase n=1 Tax=unclassified Raoultella TaxID=2627600 RepID=UPI000F4B1D24|nr:MULTISPECIES: muramoyltetrapeptide carboxypeptidase [unclassified Raoultella]MRT50829.1 muramoyltetrapeptide carboxypeptidase [Raoultella sp. RIT712]ROS16297.1 muramoyltetrapeptide carboxypeptidase [Raoultella sp. BIGb0399]
MSQFYLVAPSGYCINQEAALRGVERLQEAGHQVMHQEVIPRRQQRFAGTEHERLNDINQLATLEGPNRIVMPVRGGYGASRLLPDIDWQALAARQRENPLLICGHSDFTAIQMGLLAKGSIITFSGPMLAGNFGAETMNAFTWHHFWQALRSPEFTLEWPGDGQPCDVEGTLWGGNLAMLTSLMGTPWMPQISDGILVLEDINEHPFRVERMLLQLLHSGVLARQQALILGSFSGANPNDYDAGYDLPAVYDYLRTQLDIPVISGLDFGHEQRTVTLPLGANARLVHRDITTTLTLSGHPVLTE